MEHVGRRTKDFPLLLLLVALFVTVAWFLRTRSRATRLLLDPPLDCTIYALVAQLSQSPSPQCPVLGDGDEKEAEKAPVEHGGDEVPRVCPRFDPRNGVHAPVEAQRGREHEQLDVEGGQVEERQKPGPGGRLLRRWIVCRGEWHSRARKR